jgi:hypothetical protein
MHSKRPALPNPALRNGARAVEKSEKLFEPNRRPKAKTRKARQFPKPKTKNRTKEASFFR